MKNVVSSNTQITYNPPKTREKISSPLQKQQQQPLRISVIVFWYSLLDLQVIGLVRRHRGVRPRSWMQKQPQLSRSSFVGKPIRKANTRE